MHRTLLLLVLLTSACGESAQEKARRRAAEAEARVYNDQGAILTDTGERGMEAVRLLELRHAIEGTRDTRSQIAHAQASLLDLAKKDRSYEPARQFERDKIAAAEKNLAGWEKKLIENRALVEADRDKLLALRKTTAAQLADRKADAGVARDVLERRLEGVDETLAKIKEVLAFADEKPDGG